MRLSSCNTDKFQFIELIFFARKFSKVCFAIIAPKHSLWEERLIQVLFIRLKYVFHAQSIRLRYVFTHAY